MLGTSMRRAGTVRSLVLMAGLLVAAGCAKNVKQDAHSGPDAKYKGAKSLTLDPGAANTAEDKGIVTYPGGDRVDWKVVEMPKDKKGKLDIKLSWKPPRPGLDLAFDVYDQYGQKLGGVKPKKPSAAKKSKKKKGSKSTSIDPAQGTLYIEVYASNRGDAGAYKIELAFTEAPSTTVPQVDLGTVSVPEPPKLAAVPLPCDPNKIDASNPECKGVTAPCDPAKPDPNNPNCKGVQAACNPQALDPLNPQCLPYYPDCDPNAIDAKNPKCKGITKPPPEPINADVVASETSGTGTVITINVGSKDGVTTKWTGNLIDSSGNKVDSGAFTIFKTKDHSCFAKLKLDKSKVDSWKQVKLQPPG
jgi:hypothetical protein